jgi:two-component system LytT family response regulator
MIKAVVIDDESDSRATLISYLKKYCDSIEIIGEANSVATGVEKLNEISPDVVFLDIQMPDGSGFDLLEQLPEINFRIIFVTAFDQYAIRAIKFSALDYLLKPIDPVQLIEAVNKLKEKEKDYTIRKKYETLVNNKNSFEKIALPAFDGIIFVNIKNIVRCKADRNYTIFFMNTGEKILVTRTLKEYDEMLCDLNFYRVHQSHLINLAYVKKYTKGEGGSITMEDGSEIYVARRRKGDLLAALINKS